MGIGREAATYFENKFIIYTTSLWINPLYSEKNFDSTKILRFYTLYTNIVETTSYKYIHMFVGNKYFN